MTEIEKKCVRRQKKYMTQNQTHQAKKKKSENQNKCNVKN